MSRTPRMLLAVGEVRGNVDHLSQVLESAEGAEFVAVVGDLGAAWSKPETYREVFRSTRAASTRASTPSSTCAS